MRSRDHSDRADALKQMAKERDEARQIARDIYARLLMYNSGLTGFEARAPWLGEINDLG